MTDTTQHTPGPWYVEKTPIEGVYRLSKRLCNGIYRIATMDLGTWCDNPANAQLIAQAPTLKAENEQLRLKINDVVDQYSTENQRLEDENKALKALNAELLNALEHAQAALPDAWFAYKDNVDPATIRLINDAIDNAKGDQRNA